jgi:small basic protein
LYIVFGLLAGVLIALFAGFHIPAEFSKYTAIAILAAVDSVFGGIAANMRKNFKLDIFLTGFFSNTLLAAALVYIGNLIDADLYLVALIVFGTRLFQNFAKIRRLLLNKLIKRDKIDN